jgi:hypothetical protein
MNITITIPDAQKDRIITGLTSQFGYEVEIEDVQGNKSPNPETRPVFARRMLAKVIKDAVQSWEANEAQRVAREASISETDKLSIM